ncbi:hypothetical protein P154DRAFT_280643 [Amniculicola lignicola CBS 123094]|uniref:C2H2-type domain-containing protein n=1 Tax=Amniculicola lignicola CBS 123094 TaxID=1392246 RepID=A0A6A5W6B9_9PLEO|nr:hypothetical protein P154DRAFT_280643 [Amniculicola lignicola CBS 123094]
MKSWFQSHLPRKQRSESQLRTYESTGVDTIMPMRTVPVKNGKLENAARIAASKTSSRMSIERYLSAPLEDEPASVPAITAALRGQPSPLRNAQSSTPWRAGHSRESSYDVNSDGQRTFYTSASGLDSTDTSYSITSKNNRPAHHHHNHNRSKSLPGVPELPKAETIDVVLNNSMQSPKRPATSGTIDVGKTWTGQMERLTPIPSQGTSENYRAKAQEEIARIQEKAHLLEEKMRRYRAEREAELTPRVTDEMAYSQMAAHPKLAWILGGDATDARSIERPKSSGSVLATDDIHERPSTSETLVENSSGQPLRRSKSSGALSEKSRQALSEKRSAMVLERKPSNKRPRFYCTFCQKRFHSRVEWVRHENNIHMPEELWICCPRTGEFPERCPFCSKSHPSPSHLADHNYLSCQEKPLSERTFNRKDNFLLHISQVHKVSPGQKPLRLTELLDAWRHPLPLKSGHQALHCGFCGETFNSYFERTQHVGGHFLDGLDMMSWWSARVSHAVDRPQTRDGSIRNS